ncbi:TniQ family protein [Pseudomonas viridiflava]|uniref:TniQ family protein n=1 Tax=Pseudomonas viridiflava TaxID=33069 RepID=UPI000F053F82|nr:TniQ family protein [Pseudomonas viridiflava]
MQPQETISSWIGRSVDGGRNGVSALVPKQIMQLLNDRSHSRDFDYDYNDTDVTLLAQWGGISRQVVEDSIRAALPLGLLPPSQRLQFCHCCVAEDLKRSRMPIWRHAWSSIYIPMCVEHEEVLSSLAGDYECHDIFDRGAQASRHIINNMYYLHDFAGDRPEWLCSQPTTFSGVMGEIDCLLKDTCLIIQRDIEGRVATGCDEGNKLRLVVNLYTAILRRHRRGIDPTPYCLVIAGKIKRILYLPEQARSDSINDILDGFTDRLDPYVRMVALAIIAVLLGYQNCEKNWSEIARLFRSTGVLMPDTASGLYGLVTGGEETGIRNWITKQVTASAKNELISRIESFTGNLYRNAR